MKTYRGHLQPKEEWGCPRGRVWEEVGGTKAADILAFSSCGPRMIWQKGEGGARERRKVRSCLCLEERTLGPREESQPVACWGAVRMDGQGLPLRRRAP